MESNHLSRLGGLPPLRLEPAQRPGYQRFRFDIVEIDATEAKRYEITVDPARVQCAVSVGVEEAFLARLALGLSSAIYGPDPVVDPMRQIFIGTGMLPAIDDAKLRDACAAPLETPLFKSSAGFVRLSRIAGGAICDIVYARDKDALYYPGGRFECDPAYGFLRGFQDSSLHWLHATPWPRSRWLTSRLTAALAALAAIEAGRDLKGPINFDFTIAAAFWFLDILLPQQTISGSLPIVHNVSIWNRLTEAGIIRDSAFRTVPTPRAGHRVDVALTQTSTGLRRAALAAVDDYLELDPLTMRLMALHGVLARMPEDRLSGADFSTLLATYRRLSAHERLRLSRPADRLAQRMIELASHADMAGFLTSPFVDMVSDNP